MELFFPQCSPNLPYKDRKEYSLLSPSLSDQHIYHFFQLLPQFKTFLHTHTHTHILTLLLSTHAYAITHSHTHTLTLTLSLSLSLSLSLFLSSQDYFTTFFSEPFCTSAFIGPSYTRRFLKRPTILLPPSFTTFSSSLLFFLSWLQIVERRRLYRKKSKVKVNRERTKQFYLWTLFDVKIWCVLKHLSSWASLPSISVFSSFYSRDTPPSLFPEVLNWRFRR